jgi:UPF0716 family protein affecting phage T7 exclusion
MSLVKWGFVGLLVLPLAEVVTFLAMVLAIGWLWAMAACVVTSVIGLLVLRRSGRTDLDQFLGALSREGLRAIHLESPGLAALLAGILLVIPGFITDVLGALLFLPQFRRWARTKISHARRRRRDPRGRTVIDLAPDQWRQLPDPPIQGKRRRKLRS